MIRCSDCAYFNYDNDPAIVDYCWCSHPTNNHDEDVGWGVLPCEDYREVGDEMD